MNKEFWLAVGKRALHTCAQTALAMIGTATVMSNVDWRYVLSATALAGIVSVLKSIAIGVPEVPHG